jgi:hypothetical protein
MGWPDGDSMGPLSVLLWRSHVWILPVPLPVLGQFIQRKSLASNGPSASGWRDWCPSDKSAFWPDIESSNKLSWIFGSLYLLIKTRISVTDYCCFAVLCVFGNFVYNLAPRSIEVINDRSYLDFLLHFCRFVPV